MIRENSMACDRKNFPGILPQWLGLFALLILLALFSYNDYRFIHNDRSVPHMDSEEHIHRPSQLMISITPWVWETEYPPLQYFTSILFFKFFGVNVEALLWSLFPFCLIYIVSIYFIGDHFGGPLGGIASAMIGTATPLFLDLSHFYILAVPQAALTLLALLLLIKSRSFSNPIFSMLFGVAFGLSMLAKWTSLFYLAWPILIEILYVSRIKEQRRIIIGFILLSAPLLAYILASMRHAVEVDKLFIDRRAGWNCILLYGIYGLVFLGTILWQRKETTDVNKPMPALNLVRAAIIAIFLTIPYYIFAGSRLFIFLKNHRHIMTDYWSGKTLAYIYLKQPGDQIHNLLTSFPLIAFLVAAGLIFFVLKREKPREMSLILSFALLGFFSLQLATPLYSRYVLGVMPILAILAGYWIGQARFLRLPIMSVILAYSLYSLLIPVYSPQVEYGFRYPIEPPRKSILDLSPISPRGVAMGSLRLREIVGEALVFARGAERKTSFSVVFANDYVVARDSSGGEGLYSWQFQSMAEFMGKKNELQFMEGGLGQLLEASQSDKALVVVCYRTPYYVKDLRDEIRSRYCRESKVLSYYPQGGAGKMALVLVEPKIPEL